MNEHIKYTVTLTLLMGMAMMMPGYREAFMKTGDYSLAQANQAAVLEATVAKNLEPLKCPKGRTCTQNPEAISGITARTQSGSKLALTYDSNKKEALLTATFTVSVDGGKNGVYMHEYSWVGFYNANKQQVYSNAQNTKPLTPISKVDKLTDIYGQTIYYVPAKRTVKFSLVSTIDPKALFAGTYYAAVSGLFGYETPTSTSIMFINVNSDNTNKKTIVGEVSPYISSISPQQANVGDKVSIVGQRLSGVINIDGVAVSKSPTVGNGTSLTLIVPTSTTVGWHVVTVSNAMGTSNGIGLEILNGVPKPQLSIIEAAPSYAQVIQNGTKNNKLGQIKLTATNGDVKLGDITLNGAPNVSDLPFTSFYMYEGTTLLGTGRVNSDKYGTDYIVTIPANITIGSGVTRTLTLTADASNLGTTSIRIAAGIGGQAGADFSVVFDPNAQPHTYIVVGAPQVSPIVVSNVSVIPSTRVVSQSGTTTQEVSMGFSVTAGNDPIYLSKEIGSSVGTMMIASVNPFMTISPVAVMSDNASGDGSTYFYVAPGQTKNFTAYYKAMGMIGSSGTVSINSVNYGMSATNLSNLNYQDQSVLSQLKFAFTF